MRKAYRSFITLALTALLGAFVLSGCDDQGPAEETGEEIDETMEDIQD